MLTLALPNRLQALLSSEKPRSPRNAAILDLAALNGFRASEIAAVNLEDVDLAQRKIQRQLRGQSYWQPLNVTRWESWQTLCAAGFGDNAPLFVSTRSVRLTRIDVWRVLRQIGHEAKLRSPLTTRGLRQVIGKTLAAKHGQPAETTVAALGLAHLNSVQRYYATPDWSDYPKSEEALP